MGEEAIIGGSAGTLEEARKCLMEGADYIGFGPVFPTASKADAGPAGGLELLRHVVEDDPPAYRRHRRHYHCQYLSRDEGRGIRHCGDLSGLLSEGPDGSSQIPPMFTGA